MWQVGFRAVVQEVQVDIEFQHFDHIFESLVFAAETTVQLYTLPLGLEELLGRKLENASKHAQEVVHCERELRALFEVTKPPA